MARCRCVSVFCVAQNNALHAVEMGSSGREDPFVFMKPATSVVPVAAGTVQPVPPDWRAS